MISVVIATYNGEKYLKEQLDSILFQSRKVDEIIIFDDCSIDNTISILRDYENKYNGLFRIFINKNHQGYIKNFYKAIDKAEGDYIFLCDQDDIWCKNKIEKMIKVMHQKEFFVLACNYRMIDKAGKKIREHIWSKNNSYYVKIKQIKLKKIINYNLSMGCTMVITKEIKHFISSNIDYLSNIELPHDWAINVIAASMNKLGYFNLKLIKYRLHGKNTIGLNRADDIDQRINDYKRIIEQKRQMLRIIDILECDKKDINKFIENDICSYKVRIINLLNQSITGYCYSIIRSHLLRYASIKTILWDLYLLIKEKSNEKYKQ